MSFQLGIFFGLISMFGWALVDVLSKKVINEIGSFKTIIFNQTIGLVFILIYSLVFFQIPLLSLELIVILVASGLLMMTSYLIYFKGIEKGLLSIVAPISSGWGVITTILAIALLNEILNLYQILGIVSIFAGIFLVSANWKELKRDIGKKSTKGVPEALLVMVGWGIAFFILNFAVDSIGSVLSFLLMRLIGVIFLFSLAGIRKINIKFSGKNLWPIIFTTGLLDVIAFISYNCGISFQFVSIVSPIASSFSAVTVVLAYIFFKERLITNQKIGVCSILLGVILVSIM